MMQSCVKELRYKNNINRTVKNQRRIVERLDLSQINAIATTKKD